MLKQPTNKQTNYKPVSTAKQQTKKNGRFVEQSSSLSPGGIGETWRKILNINGNEDGDNVQFLPRVFQAEMEGFSFFWFSFRSVTTFWMLRGLLRLGVLPGLRGGTVPGRGEGKVYEVARNVGEVSDRSKNNKMPRFRWDTERLRRKKERGDISSNCSCF